MSIPTLFHALASMVALVGALTRMPTVSPHWPLTLPLRWFCLGCRLPPELQAEQGVLPRRGVAVRALVRQAAGGG